MAMRKYPPFGDAEILAAADQFETNVGDPKDIALSADDIARLTDARTAATAKMATHTASQAKARADRTAKDEAVGAVEDILSEFNRRIQPLPTVTDARRAELGLPIYDKTPTVADEPDELPVVKIDAAMPLRHEIDFHGENTKGKPEGAKFVAVYLKIGGDATGDPKDYTLLGQDSEPPYTKQFDATDSGKQAHYLFCWINSSGESGPFKMASATITSEKQTEN